MVRIALWALRIYLLILLSLIGLKFTRMYAQSRKAGDTNGGIAARAEPGAKPGPQ